MIEFAVKDMTCSHCASTVTEAVKRVDAAARCEVDLDAKRVRIESATPAAAFAESIRRAGYTPT